MLFAGAKKGPLHACKIAIGAHVHSFLMFSVRSSMKALHMSVCLPLLSTRVPLLVIYCILPYASHVQYLGRLLGIYCTLS